MEIAGEFAMKLVRFGDGSVMTCAMISSLSAFSARYSLRRLRRTSCLAVRPAIGRRRAALL
jgi:hypothetical protein